MTAQPIPAMAASSGSHNDLSVPGCSPGQSTSLAHLSAARRAFSLTFPVTQRDAVDRRDSRGRPSYRPSVTVCWKSSPVAGRGTCGWGKPGILRGSAQLETLTHVEPEPPMVDVRPEQRVEAAPVLGGEPAHPRGIFQHVLQQQGVYLLTEQRDVTAAQKAELPWRRVTTLTEMSRSVCRSGRDLDLCTTESGHTVPNGSPASSSLLLVNTSPTRPRVFARLS